jgi:hypothetical protein
MSGGLAASAPGVGLPPDRPGRKSLTLTTEAGVAEKIKPGIIDSPEFLWLAFPATTP